MQPAEVMVHGARAEPLLELGKVDSNEPCVDLIEAPVSEPPLEGP